MGRLALILVVSAGVVLSCDSTAQVERGSDSASGPCTGDIGKSRPNVIGLRGVLLACKSLGTTRLIKLYAIRDAGGPCIVITGLAGGPRACGRAPSEGVPAVLRPISTGPVVRRSADSPVEVYGETGPSVHSVVLRYALRTGDRGARRATLVRVTDRSALEAAGIREPFGYFFGTLPAKPRKVVARARGRPGPVLGSADFSALARTYPSTVFIAVEH